MFENSAGVDVVRAQHLDLCGRRIDDAAPIEGRLFTVESFYALALLRRMPRGISKQDTEKYLSPKGGEVAWWSREDPVPFLVMTVRQFARLLRLALGLRSYSPSFLRLRKLIWHPAK